jgi:hypothetical protein
LRALVGRRLAATAFVYNVFGRDGGDRKIAYISSVESVGLNRQDSLILIVHGGDGLHPRNETHGMGTLCRRKDCNVKRKRYSRKFQRMAVDVCTSGARADV